MFPSIYHYPCQRECINVCKSENGDNSLVRKVIGPKGHWSDVI